MARALEQPEGNRSTRGPRSLDGASDRLPIVGRREAIAARVGARGHASVAELAEEFGVSEVSIRSDLRTLETAGMVRRVHGGALARPGAERESRLETTAGRARDLKRAIGLRAAALIPSGASVALDVGSTCLAVAHALVERQDLAELVVVTNGLSIALALEPAIPRFTVIMTGGSLRPLQHSLVAPLAANTLPGLHVDYAVLGCNGIDADGLVTNLNLPEAEVKRAFLGAADQAILVAEASKYGARHLAEIGVLKRFERVVTAGRDVTMLREATVRHGTTLLVA